MLLIDEKPSFACNQISMSAVDSYCLRAKDSCFLSHFIARVDICLESKSSFSSVSGGVSSFLWSMQPNTDAVRRYLHAENQSDVWLCPRVFCSISLICSEVTVRLLLNASTRVIISLVPRPPPFFVLRFAFIIIHGSGRARKMGKAWAHSSRE